jgi:hypothetical protein
VTSEVRRGSALELVEAVGPREPVDAFLVGECGQQRGCGVDPRVVAEALAERECGQVQYGLSAFLPTFLSAFLEEFAAEQGVADRNGHCGLLER